MRDSDFDENNVDWEKMEGCIPTIVQDESTGQVLMLAYSTPGSLRQMRESGMGTYYSRSRGCIWKKGETSGNTQKVCSVSTDCDGDALLVSVRQQGNACHTGRFSCFGQRAFDIPALYDLIRERRNASTESSYTADVMRHKKGINKVLEKLGEETGELVLAAKDDDPREIREEAADLVYHLLMLLAMKDLTPGDIMDTLRERAK